MSKAGQSTNPLHADLVKVCAALEERYGQRKPQKFTDFIEALVAQILELGASEKSSRDTLKRLRDEYVDWNDMRVATVREIEDVLGAKYYRSREKAEDLKHLLGDLYTAFKRMDIHDLLNAEGIETLRALPDTTNIRKDMVERALLQLLDVKCFPCDEDQFRLLKHLGGVPKPLNFQVGIKKVEEALDVEEILCLSRVLREHVHVYQSAGEEEPQDLDFNWDGASAQESDAKPPKKPAAKDSAKDKEGTRATSKETRTEKDKETRSEKKPAREAPKEAPKKETGKEVKKDAGKDAKKETGKETKKR